MTSSIAHNSCYSDEIILELPIRAANFCLMWQWQIAERSSPGSHSQTYLLGRAMIIVDVSHATVIRILLNTIRTIVLL